MRARCRADCIHRSRGRPPARFRWWSLSRCDPMSDVLFSPFGHPVLGSNQESSCSSVAFFTRRRFRDRTRFQRSGDSPQGPGSFVRARFYGTRFPLPERLRSCCSATDSNPWFEALDAASTPHGKPVAPLRSKFIEHSRQRDVRFSSTYQACDDSNQTLSCLLRVASWSRCVQPTSAIRHSYNHGHPLIVELPPRSLASLGFPRKT